MTKQVTVLYSDKNKLEIAIRFSAQHLANDEKDPERTKMFHAIRVMTKTQAMLDTFDQLSLCAAILHDLPRDSKTGTIELISELFGEEVRDIIQLLTKDGKEIYDRYIDRICESKNMKAIYIKIADIQDVMEMSNSLDEKSKSTFNFFNIHKYNLALRKLNKVILEEKEKKNAQNMESGITE